MPAKNEDPNFHLGKNVLRWDGSKHEISKSQRPFPLGVLFAIDGSETPKCLPLGAIKKRHENLIFIGLTRRETPSIYFIASGYFWKAHFETKK